MNVGFEYRRPHIEIVRPIIPLEIHINESHLCSVADDSIGIAINYIFNRKLYSFSQCSNPNEGMVVRENAARASEQGKWTHRQTRLDLVYALPSARRTKCCSKTRFSLFSWHIMVYCAQGLNKQD
jgi:hypothetical protein